jgi:uncharacterized protein DUF892
MTWRGEVEDKKVLDAAIIGSAQAVEHYEISRYGTLIAWTEELDRSVCSFPSSLRLDAVRVSGNKIVLRSLSPSPSAP